MPFGAGWPHEQRKAWLGSRWILEVAVQRKALLPPGKGNAGCPMASTRHGWAGSRWVLKVLHKALHCQARAMLGAPWPAQGMAGLTLGAHGLGDHAGQDWVPQVQRKALPGQG